MAESKRDEIMMEETEEPDESLPVEMAAFFDDKASTYDDHQKGNSPHFLHMHMAVAGAIKETSRELRILDLGCGTGVELEMLFGKAPNARITCIDVSDGMLEQLRRKYTDSLENLDIVQGSFQEIPFQEKHYDYVVSVFAMHHFLYPQKIDLYTKVRKALRPGGIYLEGDYYVSPEEEKQDSVRYHQLLKSGVISPDRRYHIDLPFSVARQKQILLEAGFSKVVVLFEGGNNAVFSAA